MVFYLACLKDPASMLSYQALPTSIQVWRGHGQEAQRGEAGGQRIPWHGEAMGSFSSVCAPGVSLSARGCLIEAPPRGQPWPSAGTRAHGRNGLRARQMAVWSSLRQPSLCRHVHCALLRSAWREVTPI